MTVARCERRLDAAESVAWLLDVVFALAGRVRPYNKYLAWELRTHPLAVPEWSAERLLPQLEAMLDGDPAPLRASYAVVERECRAWDAAHGTTVLGDLLDGWGDERAVFASPSSPRNGPCPPWTCGRTSRPTRRPSPGCRCASSGRRSRTRSWSMRSAPRPGAVAYVADVDGEVVGWAQAMGDGVLQSHLGFLAVHPDHRRRGIGRLLVTATFQATATKRMDLITDAASAPFYATFAHRAMTGFRIYPGADPG